MKLILGLIGVIFVVFGLVVFSFSQAQEEAGFCGDGIVQAPEKCDDGDGVNPVETETCTAECGAKLFGWAWSDGFGWLSLNDKNCLPKYLDEELDPAVVCNPGPPNHYVQLDIQDQILGWAWSDNSGWICFGQICNGLPAQYGTVQPAGGWQAYLEPDGSDSPAVKGWAKILNLADGGWLSLSCNNVSSCATSDYQVHLIQKDFGLLTNPQPRLTLDGWAWNGNVDGSGFGWALFNPDISVFPWLQTKYGDIYARGDITGSRPPSYNATYLILSGGTITNFISAKGLDSIHQYFGPINFPTPETRYSNVLGKLDVDGLLCQFGPDSTCLNQFGKTAVKILNPAGLSQPLAGKIYYYDGNLVIDDTVEFINGLNFANGAGTVIVNGDLTINADISYQASGQEAKFINLASVAWIVQGDLKIAHNVKKLAGSFIVIGDGLNDCSTGQAHCGQVDSCYDGATASCSSEPLTVSGLMMARKFNFNRTYTDRFQSPVQGSEIIIYDGRLLANTPPGLTDFAKALPIWRSGVFSR